MNNFFSLPQLDLSTREKNLVLLAVFILLPLFLYRVLFVPLQDYKKIMDRNNKKLEKQIEEFSSLYAEYRYLSQSTQGSSIQLNQRIRRLIQIHRFEDKYQILDENTEKNVQKIVLKIEPLTLKESLRFIHTIEHNKPVIQIDKAVIEYSYRNREMIQLTLILSSFW